jgi:WD40 repeat protein
MSSLFCSSESDISETASMKTIAIVMIIFSLLCLPCLANESGVTCIASSPDGRLLASGDWDKTVKFWDAESGKELCTLGGHSDGIGAVAFSPNGETLASGDTEGTIKLWDVNSHRELHSVLSGGWIHSVAFSHDGKAVASAKSFGTDLKANSIDLWDVASGKNLKSLSGHSATVSCVAFSPKTELLASGSEDKTVRLWNLSGNITPRVLKVHSPCILSIAFSPDGKTIAVSTCVHAVKLWDIDSGIELPGFKVPSPKITAVAFSPDGKQLAMGDAEGHLDLWDVLSRRKTRSLLGHTNWIDSIAFRSIGTELASSSRDGTIKIWNADSGVAIRTLVSDDEATRRSTNAFQKPGFLEQILYSLEFNYKTLFEGAFFLFLTAIGTVVLRARVSRLTNGITQERKAVVFFATVLPIACFVWSAVVFEFQAVVNKRLLDRDGSGGEIYQCPLPNGYSLSMCDTTEYGMLFNRKKHSEPYVSSDSWQEPSGQWVSESDGVGDVRRLQLVRQFVFGRSATRSPEHHFQIDKADKFFLLDTKTDKQTEFASYQELQKAAENIGVQLKLQPIFDVYRQYRFTWFDNFAAALSFGPPILAFGFLISWIVKLRKGRQA